MSFNFALFGNRRKKGFGGMGRGGPVTIGDVGLAKFHAKITKKDMTDVQIATSDLEKELRTYQEITEILRMDWRNEMAGMEQVRYMNMKVLAAVLVYIRQVGEDLNPRTFNDRTLEPYLARLLPTNIKSEEERKAITIKYKEELLRYARAIISYRISFKEGVEAMAYPEEEEIIYSSDEDQ